MDEQVEILMARYLHGIDYLLTWNCRHIDNAETKPKIRKICLKQGFYCPEIATPIELMGINEDDLSNLKRSLENQGQHRQRTQL